MRGSANALRIFNPGAGKKLEIYLRRGKPYLKCFSSGKERPDKPEEIVRQLSIDMLMEDYGYPAERIYLRVKRGAVYKWIIRMDMPAHKVGRLWKFRRSEVDGWVRSNKYRDTLRQSINEIIEYGYLIYIYRVQ